MLELIDGLMLAGGADIDPSSYGEPAHPETHDTVPERDAFEIALTRAAIEADMPVLGICRGMQLINIALGGTLVQHLPDLVGHEDHRRVVGSFDGAEHDVMLIEGSLAASAARELAHVTKSHHHQGVDRLGEGLVVSGISDLDELPEAIELPDRRFVLGVQWHPEADPESPVVSALVQAAIDARAHARARSCPIDHLAPAGPSIYSPPSVAAERDPSSRVGGRARGFRRPPAAPSHPGSPLVTQTVAFAAPVGLCVAIRRSRKPRRRHLLPADVGLRGGLQDPS